MEGVMGVNLHRLQRQRGRPQLAGGRQSRSGGRRSAPLLVSAIERPDAFPASRCRQVMGRRQKRWRARYEISATAARMDLANRPATCARAGRFDCANRRLQRRSASLRTRVPSRAIARVPLAFSAFVPSSLSLVRHRLAGLVFLCKKQHKGH